MAVKVLTKANIEDEVNTSLRPVIIDFWNEGCGPCQALSEVLEELSEEEQDINFLTVKLTDEPELASQFRVMAAPTLLFVKDGNVVKKTIGFKSKDSLIDIIDEYF